MDFCEHLNDSIEGRRVGIIPAFMEAEGLTPEVRAAVEGAAKQLEAQGAELVEVELPHLDAAIAAYYVIGPAEAFSNLARSTASATATRSPAVPTSTRKARFRARTASARRPSVASCWALPAVFRRVRQVLLRCAEGRTLITVDYAAAYKKCDVILMPSSPRTAWKHGEISDPTQMYLSDLYTISINIAGNGGVSVPLGLGAESHLPVAAQLVGPAFKDRTLLMFARALERGFADAATGAPALTVAPDFAGKGGELA